MKRRQFLTAAAATGVASTLAAPAIASGKRNLRMVTTWPKGAAGVGTSAQRAADFITQASDGRLNVRVYGAGELVPPFEALDAVQSGTVEMCHSTPYYWVGKAKALNYFTTIPFGLTAVELASWLYHGDGQALWEEVYKPFGVVPFYAGNSGVQAGGWFNKEINSVADLEGLKFRIAGLGGEVMRRMGVTVVMTPPGDILPSIMSGAVDAAEWVGPWNDIAFGLFKAAKYYYMPAFHEPGPGLEVLMNADVYAELSKADQALIRIACSACANESLTEFQYHNIQSFPRLETEYNVQIRKFPDDVLHKLAETTKVAVEELGKADPMTAKVHASYMDFLKKAHAYNRVMDQEMLRMREIAFG